MRTLNLFLLFFFLFALNSYSLPECEGDDFAKWNNCKGTESVDGDNYAGEYKDGKWHGEGTFTWRDGTKYVGEYKDGKRHGQGTYTFANGGKYVGEFKDGKRHGQGTLILANGKKYVGEYKDGKYHGKGTYTYPDGSKYVGEYKDGNRHGQGTYTSASGAKYEGLWVENEFKGEKVGGIRDSAFNELIQVYLAYNLYDEFCGHYVSPSPFKKVIKEYIKLVLDVEKSRGVKFNSERVKDAAFEQALRDEKLENIKTRTPGSLMMVILRQAYVAVMQKKGTITGCNVMLGEQIESMKIAMVEYEHENQPKKERKRDF